MKKVNLLQKTHFIHFIGIGGVSMSALAKLAHNKGFVVSGSDLCSNNITKQLKALNIKVYKGHKISNIKHPDLVVYTAAVGQDNCELVYAKSLNIKCIDRATFLAQISNMYDNVIAVAGMHGKTTTTAMLSKVFICCNKNPTVHIGGEWQDIGGNVLIGGSEYFITEACEYKDSFLKLTPSVSIVTNIEREHLDYFKNIGNIKKSFNRFCQSTQNQVFLSHKYKANVICSNLTTFGVDGDIKAVNIKHKGGKYSCDCYINNSFYGKIILNIYGQHNLLNALAVVGVANYYNLPKDKVLQALSDFNNVGRRFEQVSTINSAPVIIDYAHHPTEIKCAIKTCKEVFKKPIVVVFQPHTYSRTKTLIKSFSKCFNGVDSLILVNTYSARESYDKFGDCNALKEHILTQNPKFKVFNPVNKTGLIGQIKAQDLTGKVVLALGAGDVVNVFKPKNNPQKTKKLP